MAEKHFPLTNKALFNIGDIVTHKCQQYRAVIIDADPIFQASGHYNPKTSTKIHTVNENWYRLLIDDSSQETYVKESLLLLESSKMKINNPRVTHHLIYNNGGYKPKKSS